jgi:Fe-S-cluster containining protein
MRDWPREKWNGAGCPFQIFGLCGVHPIRPLGCRIFFCDPQTTRWQQEQYECFHARLKRLHDELAVPYLYMEWRSALRALDLPELAQSQISFDSTPAAGKLSSF